MEAERRQVTVLFADMVGFTSFSERSGEEAAYTLMRSLSKLMDEAVRAVATRQSFTALFSRTASRSPSAKVFPSRRWACRKPACGQSQ